MDRTNIAQVLQEMLEEETGEAYGELNDSVTLRAGLELDSVDMISLLLKMEDRLGISVESEDLAGVETVGGLLDLLESKANDPPASEAA